MDPTDTATKTVAAVGDKLDGTALPVQVRLRRTLDTDDGTVAKWLVDQDREAIQRAVGYLRRTGDAGRALLKTGDKSIRRNIVTLDALSQRVVTRAWDAGDITTDTVRHYSRTYTLNGEALQRKFRATTARIGHRAPQVITRFRDDSRLKLAYGMDHDEALDGGGIVDELARAVDDSSIRVGDPEEWVTRNLEDLDEPLQGRALTLIDDAERRIVIGWSRRRSHLRLPADPTMNTLAPVAPRRNQ